MAKIFNFIPFDIKTEIFSPLPVDSILQCKCVCKTWLAFIDELLNDPYFLDAHTRLLLASPSAAGSSSFSYSFLGRKRLSKRLNPFHIIGDDNDWNIAGSCNGLVCIVRTHEGLPSFNAYICNPVTGEYVKLAPQCDRPCYSIFAVGFGYLPYTNEYKFVRITDGSKNIQISVHTLGKGTWDMIEVKGDYPQLSSREREAASAGLLFNGALYWSISPYGIIISFNLETEEFREVPSPPESRVNVDDIWLLGGCFCVIRTTSDGSRDIWVMNKEKEDYTWTMKFKIEPASMENNFPSFSTLEEKIVLSYDYMKFACCESKITSHDHVDLELNNTATINSRMVDWFQILLAYISKFEMIPYARSLVSLRALGESADVVATRETKPKTEDIYVPLTDWLESISCNSQKRFEELESNPQPGQPSS